MSGYTQLVSKKFVFEGDEVEVQFRRMKRKHMLKLLPLINKFNSAQDGGEDTSNIMPELLQEVMSVAEEYVAYLNGLKDADGEEISVSQMFDEMYFTELAANISMSLLDASLGPLVKTPDTSEG